MEFFAIIFFVKVAIIGMGDLGTALKERFDRAGIEVRFFDKHKIAGSENGVAETVLGTEAVFICAPTKANAEIAKIAGEGDFVPPIGSFSKGVDEEGRITAEILRIELDGGNGDYAVFGGPMVSEDVSGGEGASVVVGYSGKRSEEIFSRIFAISGINYQSTPDFFGVSLLGVLKNVYVIGYGIAKKKRDTGFLENYGRRVVLEMEKILGKMNSDPKLAYGPAGAGDFWATAKSPNSRNRISGEEIADKGQADSLGEGWAAAGALPTRFSGFEGEIPIFIKISEIVSGKAPASGLFEI